MKNKSSRSMFGLWVFNCVGMIISFWLTQLTLFSKIIYSLWMLTCLMSIYLFIKRIDEAQEAIHFVPIIERKK